MIQRELKVLILGEVPESEGIFELPMFDGDLPVAGTRVPDDGDFTEALEAAENYDLIVVDLEPHGMEVLGQVRDYRPVAPVVAVADSDELDLVIEAQEHGLEGYVLRVGDRETTSRLLAESIRIELKRFIEPPRMDRPSADQLYRYAHFHNVLEPFFVVSNRRHLLYVNQAGRELVHRLNGETPTVGDDVDQWSLEATVEEFQTSLDRAFAGHEVVRRRDFGAEGEDDQLHEIYYRPVVDPTGRVIAITVAVHDPGRPQLQRARTTQAVTRFAGGVAHQMNNLLNVVTANLDLLDDELADREDGTIRARCERLRHGVDRAAELTHQMQAYSRTAVTTLEALSIDAVIVEIREQLEGALADAVELEVDLQGDDLTVRADREQLEMAIGSLVSNVAEASRPGGTVRVRTYPLQVRDWETEAEVSAGVYLVLEVEDDGEGISEDQQDRIFEPFFTTRRADEHVGLGLAIVRTVVEQAGGGIEVDSVPGAGTALRAYFPVQRTRPPAAVDADVSGEAGRQAPTVLLVEEERDLRESYAELLELDGYEVMVAADGEEAEAEVRPDVSIDLLVTDVGLPDGRGIRLASGLAERIGEVPVVFLSGYGESPERDLEPANCGPTVYLSKPFRTEALLTAVADLVAADRETDTE